MPTALKAKAKTSQGNAALLPRSNRGAAETHPTPAVTYATAYDACSEIANFKLKSGIRRLRYVCNSHVACLLVMFFNGRLAMPTTDVKCKARHVFFLRLDVASLCGGKVRRIQVAE